MNKAKILRKQLADRDVVRIVGAHDGLGSKLIAKSGFEGVWASGLEISASYGVPDANILTMTDYLERACEMNEASTLPVIADCDTGYGNVNNVIHLVEKYERNGIAGICIEDKIFPKMNSFVSGKQELANIDEFSGKIEAAKNTQKSKDFFVIARVEALIAGWGMEEAIKRANIYADAGADAILIHSKKKEPDEIIEFCKLFNKLPKVVVPTTYPTFNEKEMPKLGIKIVIYANHILRSSIKAINETLGEISKTKELSSVDRKITSLSEVFELQGVKQLKHNEEKYLKNNEVNTNIIIPAAGLPPPDLKKTNIDKKPVALLEINGKTILDRNLQVLNRNNLTNVFLTTGYKNELFDSYKLKIKKNENFRNTSQLDSIMSAVENFEEIENKSLIIIFSDILFEDEILHRILSSDNEISLVIDKINKSHGRYNDLIIAEKDPFRDGRILTSHRKNKINKIGKNLDLKRVNFEFCGISYFSKSGVKKLKDVYLELKNKNKKVSFDFMALIQHMIDNDQEISGLEINGGWLEVRNDKQFDYAKKMFD